MRLPRLKSEYADTSLSTGVSHKAHAATKANAGANAFGRPSAPVKPKAGQCLVASPRAEWQNTLVKTLLEIERAVEELPSAQKTELLCVIQSVGGVSENENPD